MDYEKLKKQAEANIKEAETVLDELRAKRGFEESEPKGLNLP